MNPCRPIALLMTLQSLSCENPEVHTGSIARTESPSSWRRGLFVVFHGIASTIFESQILVHVRQMRELGVEMEVWVFALDQETYEFSLGRSSVLGRRYGVSMNIWRGVRMGLPFADLVNAFRLWRALRRCHFRPGFVHARTDYSAFICGMLRPIFGYDLIWDCRGDAVAEFRQVASRRNLLARALLSVKGAILAVQRAAARRLCTRALFVSEALRSVCLGDSAAQPSEVIPCVASPHLFHFSHKLRSAMRRTLGIHADSTVYVYSGSITYYQCFDEAVRLFRTILVREPQAVFLVVTPNPDEVRNWLTGIPERNLRLRSAEILEVNGFLNAADFGIFLRRRHPINRVASPIKFAEYCLAGLPVIMTDAVAQSIQIGRALGNAFPVELGSAPGKLTPWSDANRYDLSRRAALVLGRSAFIDVYRRVYGVPEDRNPKSL